MKRQERALTFYSGLRGLEYGSSANWTGPATDHGTFSGVGEQVTLSENHNWNPSGSNSGNVGGPFVTMKQTYSDSGCATEQRLSSHRSNSYSGPQFAFTGNFGPDSSVWPSVLPSSDYDLGVLGTTAIARCLPTNPVSDVTTFVGELSRDGIPDAIGLQSLRQRSLSAKNAGSEYLNVEFGWKPLMSDLTKLADATRKSEKILREYSRGSGKSTRRQYYFPSEITESTTGLGARPPTPALVTYMYDQAFGNLTRIDRVQRDRWFSGAFTYYLNNGSDLEAKLDRAAQQAKKLYGVRMTPDVVWNLAPWSWAADWVSNMGDVVHNLSAFQQDGLVMRYGYMMEHTIASSTYMLSNFAYRDSAPITISQTFTTEWKKRIAASPFGFGLFSEDFTPRQLAITAALGLSGGSRAK